LLASLAQCCLNVKAIDISLAVQTSLIFVVGCRPSCSRFDLFVVIDVVFVFGLAVIRLLAILFVIVSIVVAVLCSDHRSKLCLIVALVVGISFIVEIGGVVRGGRRCASESLWQNVLHLVVIHFVVIVVGIFIVGPKFERVAKQLIII
jgi:hypothetical protein